MATAPKQAAFQRPGYFMRHCGPKRKIEERIAVATNELASGITEAASASEELRRSLEQIATGAEEAASAAQEAVAVATRRHLC